MSPCFVYMIDRRSLFSRGRGGTLMSVSSLIDGTWSFELFALNSQTVTELCMYEGVSNKELW